MAKEKPHRQKHVPRRPPFDDGGNIRTIRSMRRARVWVCVRSSHILRGRSREWPREWVPSPWVPLAKIARGAATNAVVSGVSAHTHIHVIWGHILVVSVSAGIGIMNIHGANCSSFIYGWNGVSGRHTERMWWRARPREWRRENRRDTTTTRRGSGEKLRRRRPNEWYKVNAYYAAPNLFVFFFLYMIGVKMWILNE